MVDRWDVRGVEVRFWNVGFVSRVERWSAVIALGAFLLHDSIVLYSRTRKICRQEFHSSTVVDSENCCDSQGYQRDLQHSRMMNAIGLHRTYIPSSIHKLPQRHNEDCENPMSYFNSATRFIQLIPSYGSGIEIDR